MPYIELYDPEQGDEQEVKGDEQAEGPPHVRDALFLRGFIRLHPRRHGRSADGPHAPAGQPRIHAAASAVHPWPCVLGRTGPAHLSMFGKRTVAAASQDGLMNEDSGCFGKLHHCICRRKKCQINHLQFNKTFRIRNTLLIPEGGIYFATGSGVTHMRPF